MDGNGTTGVLNTELISEDEVIVDLRTCLGKGEGEARSAQVCREVLGCCELGHRGAARQARRPWPRRWQTHLIIIDSMTVRIVSCAGDVFPIMP